MNVNSPLPFYYELSNHLIISSFQDGSSQLSSHWFLNWHKQQKCLHEPSTNLINNFLIKTLNILYTPFNKNNIDKSIKK